jgi:hypothetical protein
VTEAVAAALERTGVSHVVMLSSIGAELRDRTGPVLGLHRMEQRLSRLPHTNVLALRAAYFMENHLASAPTIKQMGIMGGLFRPDVEVPMVAAQDIAEVATDRLLRKDFSGKSGRHWSEQECPRTWRAGSSSFGAASMRAASATRALQPERRHQQISRTSPVSTRRLSCRDVRATQRG